MDMVYWIGGAILFLALLGIIGKARRNQRLKREFLIQLEIAKRTGQNVIHWDPDSVR
jgi:hypothetical protein